MNDHSVHRIHMLVAAFGLALVATACSSISLPVTQIQTGATQTVEIHVPMPDEPSTDVQLNLEFVAGEMKLAPGVSGYLVSGPATFNAADFEPQVEVTGSSYTLSQGDLNVEGIPIVQDDLKSEWDLQLADTPMNLDIKAGAYTGSFELGGLSLEKLTISEGGSDLTGTFSEPNNAAMSSFTYSTGASRVDLRGLANANFAQMTFESGAGDYTLSFDGDLQRDARVEIDVGVGTLNIIVPDGANVQVTFDGSLTTVNRDSYWEQNGNVYSLSGSGPTITMAVSMAAGTLNLETE